MNEPIHIYINTESTEKQKKSSFLLLSTAYNRINNKENCSVQNNRGHCCCRENTAVLRPINVGYAVILPLLSPVFFHEVVRNTGARDLSKRWQFWMHVRIQMFDTYSSL